jgi:hypothetical protein
MQAAVASSTWRCLARSSSDDPCPPSRIAIRIPGPLPELTNPLPRYSASGLLSLFWSPVAAPGSFELPQPANASTATSASAFREVFMAVERAAGAVKNL